ncbi:MAG: ECF transporter S component, partial [Desulfomonilia bacterium]|nr:ECF transporter S component [Desulfomonilia bacterium]
MKIRDFALLALFIALVAVSTMIIRIPVPQTNGYMNLGDSMVLLAALFFGPVGGFIAGGIGSALAD